MELNYKEFPLYFDDPEYFMCDNWPQYWEAYKFLMRCLWTAQSDASSKAEADGPIPVVVYRFNDGTS